MRNQEEYLDEVYFHKTIRNTLSQILSPDGIDDNMYERLLKAFDLIRKDAYNQAIEDVMLNARVKKIFLSTGDYSGYDKYVIDKNSILKLKIK